MGFEYGKFDLLSVEYNQDYINSHLRLFGNLDLTLRFAQLPGCTLNKSSTDKSIKLRVKVGGKEKEMIVSYDLAHKIALKVIKALKKEDSDFSEGDWAILDV